MLQSAAAAAAVDPRTPVCAVRLAWWDGVTPIGVGHDSGS